MGNPSYLRSPNLSLTGDIAMAVAPPVPVRPAGPGGPAGAPAPPLEGVLRAPLVPVALALTAGIVLDRFAVVPLAASLAAALTGLAAWAASLPGRHQALPLVYLAGAVAASGAAYHHLHCHIFPDDDIARWAGPDPRPAKVRGTIIQEPAVSRRPKNDPLQSFTRPDPT